MHKRFTLPRPLGQILAHPLSRKRIEVLSGVTLAVRTGSVTGILGPNGAGKTTLLRILAATIIPDRGSVSILGRDAVGRPSDVRARLGFVLSDERSFFWRLTARHNLSFFATLANLEPKDIRPRIDELCDVIGIQQELDKPFRDLSTGMRQRLSLARALLHDPEVLLVDEPTQAMDPGAARRTRDLLGQTLAGKMKKTILLATHNVEEARELCDRVAFLTDGKIAIEGECENTLKQVVDIFAEAE
ncbi:MAG TPA: ABC transporter ATP-binding protein [Myxococcota bacterium]|nr:ABC transporter ATP-binding protein [Myxococcota bacterium]